MDFQKENEVEFDFWKKLSPGVFFGNGHNLWNFPFPLDLFAVQSLNFQVRIFV